MRGSPGQAASGSRSDRRRRSTWSVRFRSRRPTTSTAPSPRRAPRSIDGPWPELPIHERAERLAPLVESLQSIAARARRARAARERHPGRLRVREQLHPAGRVLPRPRAGRHRRRAATGPARRDRRRDRPPRARRRRRRDHALERAGDAGPDEARAGAAGRLPGGDQARARDAPQRAEGGRSAGGVRPPTGSRERRARWARPRRAPRGAPQRRPRLVHRKHTRRPRDRSHLWHRDAPGQPGAGRQVGGDPARRRRSRRDASDRRAIRLLLQRRGVRGAHPRARAAVSLRRRRRGARSRSSPRIRSATPSTRSRSSVRWSPRRSAIGWSGT